MAVIAHEISEQAARALGDAVVRMWGRLPADLQNRLFEEAVSSPGRTDPAAPRHLSAREASAHMRGGKGPRHAGAG